MVHKSNTHVSGGGGGVTTIDGISGDILLVAGTAVTISDNTPSAGNITISSPLSVQSNTTGISGGVTVQNIVACTQAVYNGLTPNANTLYFING